MFKPILIYLMLSIFPAVSGRCSKWTCWTPCSVTCGSGSQERRRTCHYPAGTRYRLDCRGSRSESRPCTCTACPIEGNWGNWMDWSPCPVTCGGGMQVRSRLCNNPAPANNGPNCSGPDSEIKFCEPLPCPIKGNWGNWMDWSPCPVTYGGGMQVRSRLCNNPAPANNGPNCSGPDSEKKSCEPLPCPINGNWAVWLSWSPCSVSCGLGGARNRKRTCSNPAPAFNGQDCSGSDSETELCVLNACPINGNWAGWLSWSRCSVSCGPGGVRNRKRTCSNPAPAFNGQDCSGSDSETELCVLTACPINGNWAGWLSWSPCSVSCGLGGARNRKRTCSNPAPAFNGQDCSGPNSETELCVLTACPINGNWAGWLSWSQCSVSCGPGSVRNRKRTCSNPAPAFNGQDCSGSDSETNYVSLLHVQVSISINVKYLYNLDQEGSCYVKDAKLNGNWTNWWAWSPCSPTCGPRVRFRYRTCSDPEASNGGESCAGGGMDSEFCDLPGCPI